ncbi:MBL fold metallo-hydrolase [Desulfospira joergensenii]|uniref:MBL fold metallo-hydrolase n=1 Tax=Desulfospira joergensenii TaxID=53329 RepID=UPI0003B3AEBE|nr:MBL fold metallo-hydrolase [Desulfospira joergensenii]
MKITTLVENTAEKENLVSRHGISLHIEMEDQNILFDTGPDDSFIKNARDLGIDLSGVDLAFISHGHYDHGGGIKDFLRVNSKARIILKDGAAGQFYAKILHVIKKNIGLKPDEMDKNRCEFISGSLKVNDQIRVVTDFSKPGFIPRGNHSLFKKNRAGRLVQDDFSHEICLVLESGGKHVLLTGCSHSGLGNMMRSVRQETGIDRFDLVLGGFHLYNPVRKKTESRQEMDRLLDEIRAFETSVFYTGHCTGQVAFEYLKEKLGDRVKPFRTGTVIEV